MEQFSEEDRGEVWRAVKAALESGPQVGARLASTCRVVLGDRSRPADYGFVNYRAMLKSLVPEAKARGRSGMDVLYEWSDDGSTGPDDDQPHRAHRSLWSAWAKPGSGSTVSVAPDGSVGFSTDCGEDAVPLPGTTTEDHKTIARAFLQEQAIPQRAEEALLQALGLEDDSWWQVWVRTLRTDQRLHRCWLGFRTEGLRRLLDEQLGRIGLSQAARQSASAAFSRPHRQSESTPAKGPSGSGPSSERLNRGPSDRIRTDGADLRSLVSEVVQRMDQASLRSLLVPAGLMQDALMASLKNK